MNGITAGNCYIRLEDIASYGHQLGLYGNGLFGDWNNVNLGVEVANSGEDLRVYYTGLVFAKDIKFGGTVQEMDWFSRLGFSSHISIENYNKVLGAHRTFTPQGTITKLDVVAGAGDPVKRSDGADSVIEVQFNLSNANDEFMAPSDYQWTRPLFEHEFEATTDSKDYRYYVQAEGAVTADDLYIRVEYVSSNNGTSEYTHTTVVSDEAINVRSGSTDWDNYIEVTGIAPSVASKVRIKCYCGYYHAANKIYIDPLVVIS